MSVWGWLVAYVVGFALLQLLLYRYFSDDHTTYDGASPDARETSTEGHPAAGQDPLAPRPPTEPGDTLVCRHCGAPNEREGSYTFCRRCVQPLQ
jgi:hypothetical protein